MTNHGADHSSMPGMYSGEHSGIRESSLDNPYLAWATGQLNGPKIHIREGHSKEASNPVI